MVEFFYFFFVSIVSAPFHCATTCPIEKLFRPCSSDHSQCWKRTIFAEEINEKGKKRSQEGGPSFSTVWHTHGSRSPLHDMLMIRVRMKRPLARGVSLAGIETLFFIHVSAEQVGGKKIKFHVILYLNCIWGSSVRGGYFTGDLLRYSSDGTRQRKRDKMDQINISQRFDDSQIQFIWPVDICWRGNLIVLSIHRM